jgi:hypothetical protein
MVADPSRSLQPATVAAKSWNWVARTLSTVTIADIVASLPEGLPERTRSLLARD